MSKKFSDIVKGRNEQKQAAQPQTQPEQRPLTAHEQYHRAVEILMLGSLGDPQLPKHLILESYHFLKTMKIEEKQPLIQPVTAAGLPKYDHD